MRITEFIIASFFIIALPGQDVLFLISQSISNGRKAGLVTAIGLAAGNIFHTTAVAFGLSILLSSSEYAITALKFIGAAYLLYLAYLSFKDKSILTASEIDNTTAKKLFFQAVMMNVLNVKAWLFAMLFFPQFLDKQSQSPILDVFILGAIFIIMVIIIFSTFATLASMLSSRLLNSERSANVIRYFKTVIMLVIALLLVL